MGSTLKQRGRYRLITEIGRGGMAMVHVALLHADPRFNKLVVIKQVRQDLADDAEITSMFLDEATLAVRLRHPNVVETYEIGHEHGQPFIAMEYLEGQPFHRIRQKLQAQGGLPLWMSLRIVADALAGIHFAHELTDGDGAPLGLVHRDLTPQNIFVTYDGAVKVLDFGIAKVRCASAETRAGIVKGKIAYLAPEQARRDEIDRRVDVFAAGVMLWEAVTGTRPWAGKSEVEIVQHLIANEFPSARSVCGDVPERLDAILAKALAPAREDRYASAAELRAAIEEYLESIGERGDLREIGNLVAAEFAEDRAQLDAEVQEELRQHPVQRYIPPARLHRHPRTRRPIASAERELELTVARTPHAPSPKELHPALTTGSSFPPVAVSGSAPPRVRRQMRPVVGSVLAAVAAITMGVWAPWKPVASAATPSDTGAVAIDGLPDATSEVMLHVSAAPAEARIFIDGEPLEGNPFTGVVAPDSTPRELRIEAPGFVTHRQAVILDHDSLVELALDAEPLTRARPNMSRVEPGRDAARPPRSRRLDVHGVASLR